ncbi:hypothetical protein C8R42DRAFT_129989 [Lentinula raphanica]|nr:hypothetical protein C8R42DRAFT_129989 [Lentinula raphanica]
MIADFIQNMEVLCPFHPQFSLFTHISHRLTLDTNPSHLFPLYGRFRCCSLAAIPFPSAGGGKGGTVHRHITICRFGHPALVLNLRKGNTHYIAHRCQFSPGYSSKDCQIPQERSFQSALFVEKNLFGLFPTMLDLASKLAQVFIGHPEEKASFVSPLFVAFSCHPLHFPRYPLRFPDTHCVYPFPVAFLTIFVVGPVSRCVTRYSLRFPISHCMSPFPVAFPPIFVACLRFPSRFPDIHCVSPFPRFLLRFPDIHCVSPFPVAFSRYSLRVPIFPFPVAFP